MEAALRLYLETTVGGAQASARLRRCTFRGRGWQRGIRESGWSRLGERAYEGRGG